MPAHFRRIAFLGFGLFGGLAFYLQGNITDPVLSFDPAQFVLTALGIEVTAPPFSVPGTLAETFRLNLVKNLDPGGFTLFFRYWALISTNPIWLRFSSVIFLVGALALLFRLGRSLVRDPALALLLTLFLLTNPVVAEWSLFPRAYGMEICGVAWLALLCYRPAWFDSPRLFAGVIAITTLFATSRYSYLLAIASFALAWALTERRERFSRSYALKALAFAIPVLPALVPLLLHHATENRDYIRAFLLNGKSWSESLQVIRTNLGSTEALLQATFFATYAFYRRHARQDRHCRFFWFLVILNLAFIPPSVIGIYPWQLKERFTIALNVLSYVSFMAAVGMIGAGLQAARVRLRLGAFSFPAVAAALIFAISGFHFDPYSDTLKVLQTAEEEGRASRSGYISPAIFMEARYLFEYGALRGHDSYPARILTSWADGLTPEAVREIDYAIVGRSDPWALEFFSRHPEFVPSRKPYYHLEYFVRRGTVSNFRPHRQ